MRDRVVSEDSFSILYCPDKYETQRMCDNAVAALKLIHEWFVTSKMIKKLFAALHPYKNILYFKKDSDNVLFNCNEMGILNIDLNNFDEDDPITTNLIRLSA